MSLTDLALRLLGSTGLKIMQNDGVLAWKTLQTEAVLAWKFTQNEWQSLLSIPDINGMLCLRIYCLVDLNPSGQVQSRTYNSWLRSTTNHSQHLSLGCLKKTISLCQRPSESSQSLCFIFSLDLEFCNIHTTDPNFEFDSHNTYKLYTIRANNFMQLWRVFPEALSNFNVHI